MAGRRSLLEQQIVRDRFGGSCAAEYVPTVIHYWAGLCIGTRRVLDRVLCFRVLQALRKSLLLPRLRDPA
jgi:hypothetical protein